ncbi:MAG: hypothetical protein IAE78_00725 [Myxococcus sp.]|nr:hypothetical protein [Myxococcus sp.]
MTKRLERGTFTFAARVTTDVASVGVDVHELSMLLEGIDVTSARTCRRRRTSTSFSRLRDAAKGLGGKLGDRAAKKGASKDATARERAAGSRPAGPVGRRVRGAVGIGPERRPGERAPQGRSRVEGS